MRLLKDLFLRHVAQTSPESLAFEVSHGKGIYLYNQEGKRYIDFISGIAVSNVGHCAPEVVKAIQEQSEKYLHTMVYGEHVQSPQVQLAQKLVEQLNSSLDMVYFVSSGSEAVEGALKLAKKYTGRTKFVSCHQSYHGSSHGSLSVTGTHWLREGYGPLLPNIEFINYNRFEDLEKIDEDTAAIILEAVQGEAGTIIPDACYLRAVKERCEEVGALMILDEIQTGFGRTGSLFAHQQFQVVPDILLLAKGLGAGMPIGAFIASHDMLKVFQSNPVLGHITTFGGHPVCCAAALASLNKILDEQLIEQIPAKEAIIRERLGNHPNVKTLRGIGLMYLVELESEQHMKDAMFAAYRRGMLIDWFLSVDNALRIAPPLIITETELHEALDILIASIEETASNS